MLEKPSRPWRWSLRWAELTALVLCAATLLSSCSTTSPNTRNEGTGNTDADANANAYVGHSGR